MVSGVLIYILPVVAGAGAIWFVGYGTAGCSLCNGENGAVHEGSIGALADEVGHD